MAPSVVVSGALLDGRSTNAGASRRDQRSETASCGRSERAVANPTTWMAAVATSATTQRAALVPCNGQTGQDGVSMTRSELSTSRSELAIGGSPALQDGGAACAQAAGRAASRCHGQVGHDEGRATRGSAAKPAVAPGQRARRAVSERSNPRSAPPVTLGPAATKRVLRSSPTVGSQEAAPKRRGVACQVAEIEARAAAEAAAAGPRQPYTPAGARGAELPAATPWSPERPEHAGAERERARRLKASRTRKRNRGSAATHSSPQRQETPSARRQAPPTPPTPLPPDIAALQGANLAAAGDAAIAAAPTCRGQAGPAAARRLPLSRHTPPTAADVTAAWAVGDEALALAMEAELAQEQGPTSSPHARITPTTPPRNPTATTIAARSSCPATNSRDAPSPMATAAAAAAATSARVRPGVVSRRK